jgi:hypothetical protein
MRMGSRCRASLWGSERPAVSAVVPVPPPPCYKSRQATPHLHSLYTWKKKKSALKRSPAALLEHSRMRCRVV